MFGRYADVSDADATQSPAPGENIAGTSPSRTFPDLAQVLDGNTNATTGKCPKAPPNDPDVYVVVPVPIVNCFSEFLPVKGYVGTAGSKTPAMHFRLTARDAVPGGGGVGHDDVTLRIDHQAGPFLVSSFAEGGSVKGGSREGDHLEGQRHPAARQEGPDRALDQRRQDLAAGPGQEDRQRRQGRREVPQGQGPPGLDHDQGASTTTSST